MTMQKADYKKLLLKFTSTAKFDFPTIKNNNFKSQALGNMT